jgi:hypothetical protein
MGAVLKFHAWQHWLLFNNKKSIKVKKIEHFKKFVKKNRHFDSSAILNFNKKKL